ncbi:helix-turn-helix domain-containing protein [Nonomuraea typhae]|uniref:helix-turn-helix domain-containing protein n=1 Tax=Nonomuraea typhae TaxID=2603600 RepID=UPI0012FC5281|nr:helix-turn-helix domain-containing protein [Nonomuraea typhae]
MNADDALNGAAAQAAAQYGMSAEQALAYLTTTDAQRIYDIPARTIRRWIHEGRLTHQRDGRTILVSCDELDQLADIRAGRRLPRTPK